MKKGQLKHLLASALLILPLAFQAAVGVQTVSAADEPSTTDQTTVTVHKLAYDEDGWKALQDSQKDGNAQEAIDNTGAILSSDELKGGTPMPGVEFTAYDVTSAYKKALDTDGTTSQKAIQSIQNEKDLTTVGTKVGDAQTTGDDGTTTFKLDNKVGGDWAVYMLLETKSAVSGNKSGATIEKANPIILVLPLKAADNGATVNVYPKNEIGKAATKDLATDSKSNLDLAGNAAHQLGDDVTYNVMETIPTDISVLDAYTLVDTPDVGLNIDASSIAVYTDEAHTNKLTLGTHYTVEATPQSDKQGAGFTLTFKNDQIADAAGQALYITYNAQINKLLAPGKTLNNSITVPNAPKPITSTTPLTTGGKRFVKVDADDKTKTLANAKFVVLSKDGKQYLTTTKPVASTTTDADATSSDSTSTTSESSTSETKAAASTSAPTNYYWADVNGATAAEIAKKDGAVTLTSADDGTFEITGLGYGSYEIQEYEAPEGYAVATAPLSFDVDATSYWTDKDYSDAAKAQQVTNAPKGILPSTGGMGIYIVIVAGLAIMAAGVFFLRRGKHHEEV
ncbi:SpaH/EbpB family LPXTG-anchored major pilin [Lacticaseibacillus parakribbianus]|uniref:SpaH/EbpB family LPXTG-anchored major pilin n=1 Tax=Lacticaseibacillus parakribbianus TaxID=2970927 RepID=UPI0021CAF32A|nr:SpaH/EbpB family LPXTG-anchored major pilin [Lacticaseibacillus parakribbianus]